MIASTEIILIFHYGYFDCRGTFQIVLDLYRVEHMVPFVPKLCLFDGSIFLLKLTWLMNLQKLTQFLCFMKINSVFITHVKLIWFFVALKRKWTIFVSCKNWLSIITCTKTDLIFRDAPAKYWLAIYIVTKGFFLNLPSLVIDITCNI